MDLAARSGFIAPLPWRDALVLAGVSLALVLFGRVLLSIPRKLMRAFGALGSAPLSSSSLSGCPLWP